MLLYLLIAVLETIVLHVPNTPWPNNMTAYAWSP